MVKKLAEDAVKPLSDFISRNKGSTELKVIWSKESLSAMEEASKASLVDCMKESLKWPISESQPITPKEKNMIKKYRKKPVCIEAVQFTRNNWDEVVSFTGGTAHALTIERRINGVATCIIHTLEGPYIATEKDFIIKGVQGEFYPCKPDIFEKTYELA